MAINVGHTLTLAQTKDCKNRNMKPKRYLKELEDCRMADERMRDIEANILLLNEAEDCDRQRRLANQRQVLKLGSLAWLYEFKAAGWFDPTPTKVLPGLP